jgi:hypothetical protein
MTNFADQLFDDLMREHGAALQHIHQPPAKKSTSRPVWVTAGGAVAAAAVATGVVLFSSSSTPAYAVTQNSDGTLTVSITSLSALGGANAKLHALGLPVVAVPVRVGCPDITSLMAGTSAPSGSGRTSGSVDAGANGSVTFDVHGVPAGDTAIIAFTTSPDGAPRASLAAITSKAPSCVSLPTIPPSAGHTSGG